MAQRKSLGKRTRFEIFKRDGFRCRYCGATPTQGVLRVDHVIPVAKGGTNDPQNLVTACHDCNGGKSDVPLEQRKLPSVMDPETALEHAEQIRAYLDAQKQVLDAKDEVVEAVIEEWRRAFLGAEPPSTLRSSLGRAIADFDLASIAEAIRIVATNSELGAHKYDGPQRQRERVQYFFGILRKARENDGRIYGARRSPAVPTDKPKVDARPVAAPNTATNDSLIERDAVSLLIEHVANLSAEANLDAEAMRLLLLIVSAISSFRSGADTVRVAVRGENAALTFLSVIHGTRWEDFDDKDSEESRAAGARVVQAAESLHDAGLVFCVFDGDELIARLPLDLLARSRSRDEYEAAVDVHPSDRSKPWLSLVVRDRWKRNGEGSDGQG